MSDKSSITKEAQHFTTITKLGDSIGGKSTEPCCGNSNGLTSIQVLAPPGSVTIDGQLIKVTPGDNNIVDVARRAKITIPAPCYRSQRNQGCCHACIVEVDGEQKFACATVPANGMDIVVDRKDLKAIRKQNLLTYKKAIRSGAPSNCSDSGAVDCCG